MRYDYRALYVVSDVALQYFIFKLSNQLIIQLYHCAIIELSHYHIGTFSHFQK